MRFKFLNKADSLIKLIPILRSAKIPSLFVLELHQWDESKKESIRLIQKQFPDSFLAIRSSCSMEDQSEHSNAGVFESVLNVDSRDSDSLTDAIDSVIASYQLDLKSHPHEKVLIQPMVNNVFVSGVITTQSIDNGSPYYVFNYDDLSGKTDSITGGNRPSKTVFVHKDASKEMIQSDRLSRWVDLCRELEFIMAPHALDIEFVEDKDQIVHLLQVRPIATQTKWNEDLKKNLQSLQKQTEDWWNRNANKSVFGNMPDWNPAEIIGAFPKPLTYSLYETFITKNAWSKARSSMGYQPIRSDHLMANLQGYPMIDVSKSFESLLPRSLSSPLKATLKNKWLEKLKQHPEFHDKIEFEIALTHWDLSSNEKLEKLGLDHSDSIEFKTALTKLTQSLVSIDEGSHLFRSQERIQRLVETSLDFDSKRPSTWSEGIETIISLGTISFSISARLAFIAESFLQSMIYRGVLTPSRVSEWKSSLPSVTKEFSIALEKARDFSSKKDLFFRDFGHLRPSTYDIESLPYSKRNALQSHLSSAEESQKENLRQHVKFEFTSKENNVLLHELKNAGLEHLQPEKLKIFIESAIFQREYQKLIFTKPVCAFIETMAHWGENLGFSREELSYLKTDEILRSESDLEFQPEKLKDLIQKRKKQREVNAQLKMPYLIRSLSDLYVIPLHRDQPNFVTQTKVKAEVKLISAHVDQVNLSNHIVAIESADPGYDWIFSQNIAGLVTQYGGVNSHMAIRCAEFNIPAAIGCGEVLFQQIVQSKEPVLIDPIEKRVDHSGD